MFGGQLLVAMVFAELVSRWPIEGSIYQWSRRLMGSAYGWMAGWIYMWTLVVAMAAVSMFSAGFVANVFGWDVTPGEQAMIAFVILALGTIANITGRIVLKVLMTGSIIAEIVGSSGSVCGRTAPPGERPVGATDGFSTAGTSSLSGPFLIAMAFVGWSFVGFESAGSIAEEVHHPRRNLPKAVIFSISFIAVVVMFSALAIILAIPPQIAADPNADLVYDTLVFHLGDGVAKVAEVLFTVGFLASFLALQTSASRVIWSYARDNALPAPHLLAKLTRDRSSRSSRCWWRRSSAWSC